MFCKQNDIGLKLNMFFVIKDDPLTMYIVKGSLLISYWRSFMGASRNRIIDSNYITLERTDP